MRVEPRGQPLEQAAETLARYNLRHLAELERAMRLQARIGELLEQALSPHVTPLDRARTKAALDVLLPGKGDSLTGVMAGYVRGLGAIQDQARKAFGAEEHPQKPKLSGLNGGPIETDVRTSFDVQFLPTEMLTTLLSVLNYIDGQHGEAPLPMPPPNPVHH